MRCAAPAPAHAQNARPACTHTLHARRYDSHRDAILRSDTHQTGGGEAPPSQSSDSVNLYSYFSPSCFKGYSDGPKACLALPSLLLQTCTS